jgi:hypothetical protein
LAVTEQRLGQLITFCNSQKNTNSDRRKVFPTDESAKKVIYLAIEQASKKWTMPIQNWKMALSRFVMDFGDRLGNQSAFTQNYLQARLFCYPMPHKNSFDWSAGNTLILKDLSKITRGLRPISPVQTPRDYAPPETKPALLPPRTPVSAVRNTPQTPA